MEPPLKLQPQILTPNDETARGVSLAFFLPKCCSTGGGRLPDPHLPAVPRQDAEPRSQRFTSPYPSGVRGEPEGHETYKEAWEKVFAVFLECIYDYGRRDPGLRIMVTGRFLLSHPRLEEIHPGQQFVWHMDARQNFAGTRFLAAFAYLSDVESGGETQFLQQLA